MKTISIVTPCFNEEDNVLEIYFRVRAVMASFPEYTYEHIFIDNASRDNTLAILKRIAATDRNVKIIANSRNFGPIRSPMHAIREARGDVVIGLAGDLQDPPEMIADFIRRWEQGTPIVIGVKKTSDENPVVYWLRSKYYQLVNRLSDVQTYPHFTGFGLYDRRVIDLIKCFDDPLPFFRGMIADIGLEHAEVVFNQPRRKKGISKHSIFNLYEIAMLGITSLSKVPLRLVTFAGFICSVLSVLTAAGYLVYKLLYWSRFSTGMAPLVIGLFFFGSVQLFFMGIIGEYVGAIHTQVHKRPLVVEKERINFEFGFGVPGREIPLAEDGFRETVRARIK
ncbi:MAG TPA: glycosyltransferase family 2 protein [Bryobacteraceae bacterium]|nr:glycosyltransferase family 2 protein [Bryobacteraceae bacterium]